jgi:hypothetical protein
LFFLILSPCPILFNSFQCIWLWLHYKASWCISMSFTLYHSLFLSLLLLISSYNPTIGIMFRIYMYIWWFLLLCMFNFWIYLPQMKEVTFVFRILPYLTWSSVPSIYLQMTIFYCFYGWVILYSIVYVYHIFLIH